MINLCIFILNIRIHFDWKNSESGAALNKWANSEVQMLLSTYPMDSDVAYVTSTFTLVVRMPLKVCSSRVGNQEVVPFNKSLFEEQEV